ncbi:hypothetical protein C8F04DRAFT_1278216 [Mycena alexandri]|uniref:Uncharacterized protein n=1 Tax=Mycena alexandri TaxID=1745969 RepID=A0AAD6S084_9AGAR|nr:hypothetical protein C8F04DRAFT_1280944 [Mycena alexandri]KAJ7018108.1 hypothetical protein C8F04DRAFT_1278216 [Mycena alexandri]
MASTLTHLVLQMESEHQVLTGPDLHTLLQDTSALTSLSMDGVRIDHSDPHLGQPLQLNFLTEFHLVACDDISLIPITELDMPSLRTLRVTAYPRVALSLITMGANICSTVTSLVAGFRVFPPSVADLATFLKAFSRLENLDLRPMVEVGLVLNAVFTHCSDLSPALRCIWLPEKLDDTMIAGIIAKANATHFGADLHLVTLKGHKLDGRIPYESSIREGGLISRALGYDTFNS